MQEITVIQGSTVSFDVVLNDSNGNPVTTYTGSETLTAVVWAGDDQAPLFAPTVVWVTSSAALVAVTISGGSTAALTPATYRIDVLADGVVGATAALQVEWAPGSAPVRPTYHTITDLRREANWIDDLQNLDQHQAGFADECADARDWLDENVLRNYRAGFVSLLGEHGLALDSWFTGGNRRSQLTNYTLKLWLSQNLLMVRPRIVKVCVFYTLAQICKQQIGVGGKWPALAAMYRHQCNSLLAGTTAEIDLAPQDGYPDIPITFSAVNTLFT